METDRGAASGARAYEAPSPLADPRAEDRHVSPYSRREKIGRMLWSMAQGLVFRWTFHTWNRTRVRLLNAFGARVHPTCTIRRTVRIECPWNLTMGRNCSIGDRAILYCLGPITLGERVSVSQHAHVCAGSHDFSKPHMPLLRPPITIEDDAWIAADAFVGPGVRVGRGAILGARGCAFTDLEEWRIYRGNPADGVRDRPRFAPKNRDS